MCQSILGHLPIALDIADNCQQGHMPHTHVYVCHKTPAEFTEGMIRSRAQMSLELQFSISAIHRKIVSHPLGASYSQKA